MRTIELLAGVEFNEKRPQAQSLHSNQEARSLRFAFLPGQSIKTHDVTVQTLKVFWLYMMKLAGVKPLGSQFI